MCGFRLYFRLIAASVRAQLRYPSSFLMTLGGQIVGALVDFAAVWALFGRFKALGQWNFYEVTVFYALTNLSFCLGESVMRGFDMFQNHVRTGEFDRVMLRPRSTFLQVLGSELQLRRLGRIACSVALICMTLSVLRPGWNFAEWMLLIAAVIGGACVYGGLFVLQAAFCFVTVNGLEVFNLFTNGGLETVRYPLDVYGDWLKRFFCCIVPLAVCNYWPASVLFGKNYLSPAFAWLSPLIGPAFLALCLPVWLLGVRRYRSTGS